MHNPALFFLPGVRFRVYASQLSRPRPNQSCVCRRGSKALNPIAFLTSLSKTPIEQKEARDSQKAPDPLKGFECIQMHSIVVEDALEPQPTCSICRHFVLSKVMERTFVVERMITHLFGSEKNSMPILRLLLLIIQHSKNP
jgi:hypothetical protein